MKITQKYKKLSLDNKIFYGLIILSLGIWILFAFGALGACLFVLIKSGLSGLKDALSFINFGDFFDVLNLVFDKSPYIENGDVLANYPPLAYLILYPFSKLAGADGLSDLVYSARAMLSLGLLYIICLPLIAVLSCRLFKNEDKNKRILFTFFILFSFPVIYLLIRANVLLITIIFILFFINFYNSEKRILRELALITLALAIATKLYPLFFIIILIRDKRVLDFIKVAVYSLILLFLPFLFFEGGFKNIEYFFNNLIGFTNYSNSRQRDVSIDNAVRILFKIFNIDNFNAYKITALSAMAIVTIFSLIASLFIKKLWKVFLLIALVCVSAPVVSFAYSLIFLIPSIAYYLKEEKSETDIIFAILFFILFSALGFFVYLNAFIVLAIQIALIIQASHILTKFIKKLFLWVKGLNRKVKFALIAVLNALLNLIVYFIILLSLGLDLNGFNPDKILIKIFAALITSIICAISSYFWHKNFNFESGEKVFTEKAKFILVYIFAALADMSVKAGLSYANVLNDYLIAVISTVIVIFITYLGQRYFVFKNAIKEK